jgi:hypothetical protein
MRRAADYDRPMAARVAIFLDYQNVYMGARGAFHPYSSESPAGQVDPHALGELLVQRGPPGVDRELSEVRVYRGQPDSRRIPRDMQPMIASAAIGALCQRRR